MDFTHSDQSKNLPTLGASIACLALSSAIYFFIAWGMPFDWIIPNENFAEIFGRADDAVIYPCDDELEELLTPGAEDQGEACLNVQGVTHIYPDGTQAVKGMSFKVRKGEVLSYLGNKKIRWYKLTFASSLLLAGANGAGKSTTMGMLCGTLPITFGDAIVNGFSITRDKVLARRNLGICMQSDVRGLSPQSRSLTPLHIPPLPPYSGSLGRH